MTQEPRPTPLLPCPFCGGDGSMSEDDRGRARWVSCDLCEADGPFSGIGMADTDDAIRDRAITKWNERVPTFRALTPEQVERAILLVRREGPLWTDNIWIDAAYKLLREVVGDER